MSAPHPKVEDHPRCPAFPAQPLFDHRVRIRPQNAVYLSTITLIGAFQCCVSAGERGLLPAAEHVRTEDADQRSRANCNRGNIIRAANLNCFHNGQLWQCRSSSAFFITCSLELFGHDPLMRYRRCPNGKRHGGYHSARTKAGEDGRSIFLNQSPMVMKSLPFNQLL